MTESWRAALELSISAESDLLHLIACSPVLGGLDQPVLRKIAASLELGSIAAGETLFEKGDGPGALYLVVRGELEAIARRDDGSDLVLSKIGPGSLLGEIQVLTRGERSATVRAAADSELGRLSGADLDALAEKHPEILESLASVIRERLRRDQLVEVLPQLFGTVDETILRDVEEAIEWVLMARSERLCRRGDRSQHVYLTVSGRLCAAIDDEAETRVLGETQRRLLSSYPRLPSGGWPPGSRWTTSGEGSSSSRALQFDHGQMRPIPELVSAAEIRVSQPRGKFHLPPIPEAFRSTDYSFYNDPYRSLRRVQHTTIAGTSGSVT